ncbi:MAG: hypothetical protein AAF961_00500 [Planctomycetota bacterium]
MFSCPLCLKKLRNDRPAKWDPYLRCSCGALFQVRCRLALPYFASLGLRRTEPIRLPPPEQYFVYRQLLVRVFASLRQKCDEEVRAEAVGFAPLCDLIRFGDAHPPPIRAGRKTFYDPDHPEFYPPVRQRAWPEIGDFEEFHTNCDFASWCLQRIGDGRFSDRDACSFGYVYQHFPHVRFYRTENDEIAAAWKKATKGRLPSPRRAQVRARLPW